MNPQYKMPINRLAKIRYSIGIDPDVNKSGFAVWDRHENKVVRAMGLELYDLYLQIDKIDVGLATFSLDAGWLNEKANYHVVVLPPRLKLAHVPQKVRDKYIADVREKVANKVGLNAGYGQAIWKYLLGRGHKVTLVEPTMSKWNREMIKRQTGYATPANEDIRDAIRLAYCYKHLTS